MALQYCYARRNTMNRPFTMAKYDVVYCKVMTDEFEVKSKVDTESNIEQDLENVGAKIKAGAKAVAKKIADPNRDLENCRSK